MSKLKKISACLLSGILLFGTISFARTGTVNAPSGLVLREKASTGANPITTVSDNETVEILEENDEWYKVKYGNYEGYMFAKYVEAEDVVEETPEEEVAPEEEPQNEEQISQTEQQTNENTEVVYSKEIVINSTINIYLIPSITSKLIKNVEQGKTITINYELNNWINITCEGATGWVRKYYIDTNAEDNTNPKTTEPEDKNSETNNQNNTNKTENKKGYINVSSSANIRETANTSANIITTLLTNAEVTIIGEEEEFYKIQYRDITGYVAKSLVSDEPV